MVRAPNLTWIMVNFSLLGCVSTQQYKYLNNTKAPHPMSNGMIVGLVIAALALCGGGAIYFLLSSEKTTPVASVQEKKSDSQKTDCKLAAAVVPAVGLIAGVGVAATVAACQ